MNPKKLCYHYTAKFPDRSTRGSGELPEGRTQESAHKLCEMSPKRKDVPRYYNVRCGEKRVEGRQHI